MERGERYVNLFTDFGFKKIFGEEINKALMIDFLNVLFTDLETIINITYLKNEHAGHSELDRKAVFDLYCENDKGERFIVEVQRVKQKFFKDRSLYYATYAIQEQAIKGKEWKYELKGVYTLGIMDFTFDERSENQEKLAHHVQLMDTETCEVFYDKLTFLYLEVPKFNKTVDELETNFDKWLFILKNLHKLDKIPISLRNKIFEHLFEQAEIAKFNKKERLAYEDSLKEYRDLVSAIETAKEEARAEGRAKGIIEGREEGRVEGRIEGKAEGKAEGIMEGIVEGKKAGEYSKASKIAQTAITEGFDNEVICKLTGLSHSEVEQLRKEIKS